jgi:hypothetical protein
MLGLQHMFLIFPSREQWNKWSLPSRLTAICTYITIIAIFLSIFFFFATRKSNLLPQVGFPHEENQGQPTIKIASPQDPPMATSKPEIGIIAPLENEEITIRRKESLVVRGEITNVEFNILEREKALIHVRIDDPYNSGPLKQNAIVSNSLSWRVTFDNIPMGVRIVEITALLQGRKGTLLSSTSIKLSLRKEE